MNSTIGFRIVEFIFRIIGLIVFGYAGVAFGNWLASLFELPGSTQVYLYRWLFLLLGGLGGFILTPYFTTRPARAIRVKLGHLSAETLFAGLFGLIIGLLTAALLSFPFSQLPGVFGQILPFLGVIVFSYLGISLFVMRQGDLMGLFSALSGRGEGGSS
ncbi:MAG TPA: PIN domain nuclease, partial [Anaerolineales bacterium]|nr:PIN domain nuclease [Anaerolineales bacterium]